MTQEPTVNIVDDDPALLDSIKVLVESDGFNVVTFGSARAFLASEGHKAEACLVADIRMPEMSGLELQEELNTRGSKLPVIIMTGHGDVPLAVRAMKAGAIDFLEKPFEQNALLDSIHRALTKPEVDVASRQILERMHTLTERERQVLDLLILGKANKVIAYELSISPRTVEIHRARVMDKMAARSLAELVRMVLSVKPAE
jgi:two-component system response regulator FixJ